MTTVREGTDSPQANTAARCLVHTWCSELGDHTMHSSAYIQAPTPDGLGDDVLLANLMCEDEPPTVGFLDLNLTAEQTRARVAELHRHLDAVAELADLLDGGPVAGQGARP